MMAIDLKCYILNPSLKFSSTYPHLVLRGPMNSSIMCGTEKLDEIQMVTSQNLSLYSFLVIVSILNNFFVIKISIAFIYQGATGTFWLLERQSIDNQNASTEGNESMAGIRDSNWICLNTLSSGSRLLLDLRTIRNPEFINRTKNIMLLYSSAICLYRTDLDLFVKILNYF